VFRIASSTISSLADLQCSGDSCAACGDSCSDSCGDSCAACGENVVPSPRVMFYAKRCRKDYQKCRFEQILLGLLALQVGDGDDVGHLLS